MTLICNLGKYPERQTLEGGVNVAKFSLATTESSKDAEGTAHSQTERHPIGLWRGLAAKYLRKGRMAYLEGKARTRAFEDKTGVKKQVTESFLMLDKPE